LELIVLLRLGFARRDWLVVGRNSGDIGHWNILSLVANELSNEMGVV
jgi:hypothetical protein